MLLTAVLYIFIMLCVGSFDNIPAYDPSATSCTNVTTSTLFTSTQTVKRSTAPETSTASATSAGIISWTITPVQTILSDSHVRSPSLTSSVRPADGAQDHSTIVAVSVAAGILIVIIAVVIICCIIFRSVHIFMHNTEMCDTVY